MKQSFLEKLSSYLEFPLVTFILLASIAVTLGFVIQQQVGNQVMLLLGNTSAARIREVIWIGVALAFVFIYIYILTLFRSTSRELVLKSKENAELLKNVEKQLSDLSSMEGELNRNYQMQTLLSSMLQVSLTSLSLDQQLDQILALIVSIPWQQMKSRGCIYLYDEKKDVLVLNAYLGLSDSTVTANRTAPRGHCLCGKVVGTGNIGFLEKEKIKHNNKAGSHPSDVHYYLPIKHGDNLLGVLNLLMNENYTVADKDDEFFLAVVDVLAGIIEQKRTEEKLNQSVSILRTALGGTIHAMALTVETRDPYTAGHQRRVSNLARAIATEMGLSQDQIEAVRIAGIVHDIGKISVPSEILSKPGVISLIEHSLINTHPQAGYDILNSISFPWPIAKIVLQHHERMDGSGYPAGLKQDDILIEARVLSVADVVEAMASHRPYRPSRGIQLALDEITKNRDTLYDPRVVDACLRLFLNKGFQFDLPASPDRSAAKE